MRLKHGRVGVIVGLVALVASGCVALVNAPAGGGAVTTGVYRIGPLNLAAMGQPGWESETSATNVPRPAGAIGIKSVRFDLVDQDGTPIPRANAHLHHVLLINPSHPDVLCPGRPERFAGAGAERTPLDLPDPYAYLVGAGDHWNALWHVMNMTDAPMTAYIQYTVGYQVAADSANTRNVVPFFADVTGCGASVFNVPGDGGMGSVYSKSRTWNAPYDGIMVYAGGHLHGGGIDLTLHDDTTGAQCVMNAHYDMPMPMVFGTADAMGMMNHPMSVDPCPAHNLVAKGRPYTLTAHYDNSQPYTDVMGISLVYVWPGQQ